jgi:ubiquinol-cytochrome c reductase cytochrome c subunit
VSSPRRPRPHAVYLVAPLLVTAVATPFLVRPAGGQGDDELVDQGRELYQTGCSSCHGDDGRGVVADDGSERGPTLENSGEASAYYYLSTGRMPLGNSEEQPRRKEPAYNADEIDALVAYVDTLGNGPPVPDIDVDAGDLAAGGEIFRANCQACHSAAGGGGALSYGDAAPRLGPATPTEVGAAVRTGPGEMPVFGGDIITDTQLDSLVRYVEYLDDPDDPGGLPIGRTGPIPEGFVAWLIGMGALLALVAWIGTRSPIRRPRAER